MTKFAVFDIDGTVLRWQFFHAIVNELGKEGLLTKEEHDSIKHARMQWKTRSSSDSFHKYEKVLVETYLGALPHISQRQHNQAEDAVYEEYKHQLFTYTRDLIKELKERGYYLLAISGSHHYVVEKFCQGLGIDDFIAAKAIINNGKYTGKLESPIFDKSAALNKLVKKHNLTFKDSYGTGDSASDAAMLEMVENPIAFNPDQKLYKIAKTKGWQIVLERKNVIYELLPSNKGYKLKD